MRREGRRVADLMVDERAALRALSLAVYPLAGKIDLLGPPW